MTDTTQDDELVERLGRLRKFLDGSGTLADKWFGDTVVTPAGRKASYWWRHDLSALDEADDRIAALRAENEALRRGLARAVVWFDEYALLHRAKGTADGNAKGRGNQDRADQLRALLGSKP